MFTYSHLSKISNAVGAMENWGLIIGSAEYYLLDTDCSGMMAKNQVITGTRYVNVSAILTTR